MLDINAEPIQASRLDGRPAEEIIDLVMWEILDGILCLGRGSTWYRTDHHYIISGSRVYMSVVVEDRAHERVITVQFTPWGLDHIAGLLAVRFSRRVGLPVTVGKDGLHIVFPPLHRFTEAILKSLRHRPAADVPDDGAEVKLESLLETTFREMLQEYDTQQLAPDRRVNFVDAVYGPGTLDINLHETNEPLPGAQPGPRAGTVMMAGIRLKVQGAADTDVVDMAAFARRHNLVPVPESTKGDHRFMFAITP